MPAQALPDPRYAAVMSEQSKPRVTDADREYMRRIGEYERQAQREQLEYLWSLPIEERVRRSFERTQAGQPYPRKEPKVLTALYNRARRLGLYRD